MQVESQDDGCKEIVPEPETDRGSEHERNASSEDSENDTPPLGPAKKSEVDLQTGGEHQQQLSQLSEEVRNGPVFAKYIETVRSD